MPSNNIELQYTFMDISSNDNMCLMTKLKKDGQETVEIGYEPYNKRFALYYKFSNRQDISATLKPNDRVTLAYNNGIVMVKLNDKPIGAYSKAVPDITGSSVTIHAPGDRWWQTKDFTIKKIKPKNMGTIFTDPFTSNSGNWTIPEQVQKDSSYSSDGWKINNNSSDFLNIFLNDVTIRSPNIEIQYTYMGMLTTNDLSMTINIRKDGNSTSSVGYNSGLQQFQIYTNNGSNMQAIPYSLKEQDQVTIVYNSGVLSVKVNDNAIGAYRNIVPDIMGSTISTWATNGKWFQIKDFIIRESNNKQTIFKDPLTSNSGQWAIPQETLSASTYNEDGWKVASTSNGQYVTINNVTIPSSNFELEYKYMGGSIGDIRVPAVDFVKDGLIMLGVGYDSSTKNFQVYNYNNSNATQQEFPIALQANDIIKIIYNSGVLKIEVNNSTVGTYNKEMDVVGTTVNFYAKKDRWYILKDLIIRAEY